MLELLMLLGFGLVAAGVYKARSEKQARNAKLKRIQKEIARREALENKET